MEKSTKIMAVIKVMALLAMLLAMVYTLVRPAWLEASPGRPYWFLGIIMVGIALLQAQKGSRIDALLDFWSYAAPLYMLIAFQQQEIVLAVVFYVLFLLAKRQQRTRLIKQLIQKTIGEYETGLAIACLEVASKKDR